MPIKVSEIGYTNTFSSYQPNLDYSKEIDLTQQYITVCAWIRIE